MKGFIQFVVFMTIIIFSLIHVPAFLDNISDYFSYLEYPNIDLSRGPKGIMMSISIFEVSPYMQTFYGFLLIFIGLVPLILWKKSYFRESSEYLNFKEGAKETLVYSLILMVGICALILLFRGFLIFTEGLSITLWNLFGISYFLEHNLAWILALVGTPLGWILVVYLYEKYKHHIDYTREIIRQYIFFIIVTGIFSLIFFSPEKIIFHDERLCKGNTCYPYSSIKSINLDKSGYNVQLIFKPFDTTIEFSVPQKDMLVSKMSDGDEEHVSSFLVHSPILNINDRISYVISEYESNLDDDFTVEQISFFSEQKNFEKTLDAIISGKIKYPETLEHDWIATLNILHKKTGLFPQVIDF